MRNCDSRQDLDAEQKDKLLRFSAVIKAELDRSGRHLALVARSGLDLSRFGTRYSHAGVSLKSSPNTAWSVRQLYYACDERRPRIFDEGMSGFVFGTDDPASGFVSVILLPEPEADELEQAALDNRKALQLLGASYSANAYAFSERYQNCNQWVIEMLATAWSGVDETGSSRTQAQRWLKDQGYEPSDFEVGRLMMLAGAFVPWLHSDDHPSDDIDRSLYRISMPASIEGFVRRKVPGASRFEFCHDDRQIVIRSGWEPIADGCRPGGADTVIPFD